MKITFYLLACATVLFFSACSSSKSSDKQDITGPTWELEYLSGPKFSLKDLFPQKKPQLTFEKESKTVTGNDGCNGYSAPFTLEGNQLTFGEPGPSTLMYCGEGDAFFREHMKNIDAFRMEEGKLVLLTDETPMLRFHKIDQ